MTLNLQENSSNKRPGCRNMTQTQQNKNGPRQARKKMKEKKTTKVRLMTRGNDQATLSEKGKQKKIFKTSKTKTNSVKIYRLLSSSLRVSHSIDGNIFHDTIRYKQVDWFSLLAPAANYSVMT